MPLTFGRQLLDAAPADALALERDAGRADTFDSLDRFIGDVVRRSLGGERVATLEKTRARGSRLTLLGLGDDHRAWIRDARSLQAVQANGFWSMPPKASLQVGPLSTAWSLRERGRFGPQVSADERARLDLDDAETIAAWAVLAPALSLLYRPVYLRTVEAGTLDRAAQLAAWQEVETVLRRIGAADLGAFKTVQYGGGWSKLTVDERHEALLHYTAALHDALPPDVGTRLRLALARPPLEKYYACAKADGTALQKRVVVAALRPALVGVWGGDWVNVAAYLGESLHPQEHVATAIPKVSLTGPPAINVAEVAHETGAAPDDVAAIAAAVFGEVTQPDADAAGRTRVLQKFWNVFDHAHARQVPGMPSLWGLVDSGSLGPPLDDDGVYNANLYQSLVPPALAAEIETLWGGHLWTRFPDRMVTEWSPHARMADAFGPALTFWEGVALTGWFVCEGPYSRTDFDGLQDYHARELAALADAGTPVDPDFLRAVASADRLLGPPQQVWTRAEATAVKGTSLTLTFQTSSGSRRDGFERVRDLVTEGRRAWAKQYLDAYLQQRSARSLHGAVEAYHVAVNARGGKSPTARQTARDAANAVNLWLGGDVGAFYGLLKEKRPSGLMDGRRLTRPPHVSLAYLHAALVGAADPTNDDSARSASRLLQPATAYVRWLEATGSPPGVDQIKDFQYQADHFAEDPAAAWERFVALIDETCLSAPVAAKQPHPPRHLQGDPLPRLHPTRTVTMDEQMPDAEIVPEEVRRPWWKRLLGG